MASIAEAARAAGVPIVTGDTKVVPHGAADGMFITTSGVGLVPASVDISARNAQPGDRILLSGTIGDHGMAVMSSAKVWSSKRHRVRYGGAARLVAAMLAAGEIHALRDPTRGGLATRWTRLPDRRRHRRGS